MKNNLKAITSKITIQAEKWTLLAPQMPLYTFPWSLPPPFPRNNDYIFVIIILIFFVVLLSTYESLNNVIISCSQILYMYIELSCNTLLCLTSFVQYYALRFIHCYRCIIFYCGIMPTLFAYSSVGVLHLLKSSSGVYTEQWNYWVIKFVYLWL